MIVEQYGSALVDYSGGDRILAIQVARKEIRQRPVAAIASFTPLPTPSQQNSQSRLIVYRGAIQNLDATDLRINVLQAGRWEPILGVSKVLYDVVFTATNQPCHQPFADWSDELVKTEPGEALGAAIIVPIDLTTSASLTLSSGLLTFSGIDIPDENDADVRRYKAR